MNRAADRKKQAPCSLKTLVLDREMRGAGNASPLAIKEAVRARRASVMAAILGDAGVGAKEYVGRWLAGRGAE